jgi:hypothetical protein
MSMPSLKMDPFADWVTCVFRVQIGLKVRVVGASKLAPTSAFDASGGVLGSGMGSVDWSTLTGG